MPRRRRGRLLVHGRGLSATDAGLADRRLPLPRLLARQGTISNRNSGMTAAALRLIALALIAVMPTPVPAANISLLGEWEIVEAAPGPWTAENERAGLTIAGKHLLKLVITFSPNEATSSHKMFTCKRVVYAPHELQLDALFLGNLPERI